MTYVDVWDAATAHVRALDLAKPNERYILASEVMSMWEASKIFSEEFKPHGFNVCTSKLPFEIAYTLSFFSNDM